MPQPGLSFATPFAELAGGLAEFSRRRRQRQLEDIQTQAYLEDRAQRKARSEAELEEFRYRGEQERAAQERLNKILQQGEVFERGGELAQQMPGALQTLGQATGMAMGMPDMGASLGAGLGAAAKPVAAATRPPSRAALAISGLPPELYELGPGSRAGIDVAREARQSRESIASTRLAQDWQKHLDTVAHQRDELALREQGITDTNARTYVTQLGLNATRLEQEADAELKAAQQQGIVNSEWPRIYPKMQEARSMRSQHIDALRQFSVRTGVQQPSAAPQPAAAVGTPIPPPPAASPVVTAKTELTKAQTEQARAGVTLKHAQVEDLKTRTALRWPEYRIKLAQLGLREQQLKLIERAGIRQMVEQRIKETDWAKIPEPQISQTLDSIVNESLRLSGQMQPSSIGPTPRGQAGRATDFLPALPPASPGGVPGIPFKTRGGAKDISKLPTAQLINAAYGGPDQGAVLDRYATQQYRGYKGRYAVDGKVPTLDKVIQSAVANINKSHAKPVSQAKVIHRSDVIRKANAAGKDPAAYEAALLSAGWQILDDKGKVIHAAGRR